MSTAVLPPPTGVESLPRKKFTRDEVEQMLDLGLFTGQRFELIDGDLIDKMGQKPPHASAIQLLMEWLILAIRGGRVRGQAPIDAAKQDREQNLPEPDISVLIEWKADFLRRHPRGDELLLAIEVSDTTFRADATTKRDLYARANVPECWVIDLNGRRVIVYRAPVQGTYSEISTLSENETLAIEGHSIAIAQLLP